jgi:hypothetical protein
MWEMPARPKGRVRNVRMMENVGEWGEFDNSMNEAMAKKEMFGFTGE